MGDYADVLRGFGGAVMAKSPTIPKKDLMVEGAEFLESIPLFLYKDVGQIQTKALVPSLMDTSAEKVAPNLQGVSFSPEDFGNDFSLGNAIDGGF